MKINIVSLILLFAVIFYSCKKDFDEIDIKTPDPRLVKIKIANLPFYGYSYTSDDIVVEEISTYNLTIYSYNELLQIVTVDYFSDFTVLDEDYKVNENAFNNKGLLNIEDTEKGGVLELKYDNYGKLKTSYFSQPSVSSHEYSEFSYNDSGRISRQTLFWDNKVAGYIDYLYDSAGNLIMETLYSLTSDGKPELSTTTKYEFDNYKNPFKSTYILYEPGMYTNANNIVKEIFTIHFKPGEGTDIEKISLNIYEYNNMGYPVRKNGNTEYLYE